ncbi:S-adenosyl-L-methionine-dependent methyltransferase [Pseudohyphozyma bogoriensis]|nr:S-adenosyl-L-methionine-dependent methyltransferase [Pseudohyphozyma bogoriensis]
MTASSGKAELKALLSLLTTSITAVLESEVDIPSLRDPVPAPPPLDKTAMVAIAAASQVKALLEGPAFVAGQAFQFHVSSALRVVVEAHVVETLREAGKPEGLPVSKIAESSAIDPAKLERVLRLLAAHHIFSETTTGVFANNRTSIGLDTGRSVAELKAVDDVMKASAHLSDVLLDPETSHSYSPSRCAYQPGHSTDLPCWEHFALPENEVLLTRFGMAMRGADTMSGGSESRLLPDGFDFKALKEGATIVDVGGGTGSMSLAIAHEAPQANIVLQDRPEVISGEAKFVWEREDPQAVASGRVKLTPHDFFTAQPIIGADVYLLRAIIHDWPDKESTTILSQLSAVASSTSKLIIVEHIIDPLCWPNGTPPQELYPLIPSIGSTMPYLLDMQMLSALNAQERLLDQYEELGRASGWKLENVYSGGKGGWDQMIFCKAQ